MFSARADHNSAISESAGCTSKWGFRFSRAVRNTGKPALPSFCIPPSGAPGKSRRSKRPDHSAVFERPDLPQSRCMGAPGPAPNRASCAPHPSPYAQERNSCAPSAHRAHRTAAAGGAKNSCCKKRFSREAHTSFFKADRTLSYSPM